MLEHNHLIPPSFAPRLSVLGAWMSVTQARALGIERLRPPLAASADDPSAALLQGLDAEAAALRSQATAYLSGVTPALLGVVSGIRATALVLRTAADIGRTGGGASAALVSALAGSVRQAERSQANTDGALERVQAWRIESAAAAERLARLATAAETEIGGAAGQIAQTAAQIQKLREDMAAQIQSIMTNAQSLATGLQQIASAGLGLIGLGKADKPDYAAAGAASGSATTGMQTLVGGAGGALSLAPF